jgi:hypothetical protein
MFMANGAIIFIFLDGCGLGNPVSSNPFHTHGLPHIEKFLGQQLLIDIQIRQAKLIAHGIDACLGIPGIPQSATGQTALFTGQNAARHLGYHLPAFPNQKLISLINQYSLLKQLKQNGCRAIFGNAYSKEYFERVEQGLWTHSVTTHCMLAANIPFLMLDDLRKHQAVYWDITRAALVDKLGPSISISPEQAGADLAAMAKYYDFILFESFVTDLIGHKANLSSAEAVLKMVDTFLGAVIANLDSSSTVIITSDHGNIEDCAGHSHTANPVPLVACGPQAMAFADIKAIDQLTPRIVHLLN